MSIRATTLAQRLNDRVRLERDTQTRAANGSISHSWAKITDTYAAVDGAKATGAEPYLDGATRPKAQYTVWIRADVLSRFALTVVDRIVWGTRILDIDDIPDQGLRGRLIPIFCTAGVNKG